MAPSQRLRDGQTAWITGASSGIGEALAHTLDARGLRLVLSSRREERLRQVRDACAHPERHVVLPLDLEEIVRDPASLQGAARRVLEHFGRLDLLVNNAGVSQRALALETDLAVDRRLIETDYLGTVALTKAVLPSMVSAGAGRIVVVSSLVGKIGTPLRSSYSAAKHALHGFFESLAAEVWNDGVRVTMVCPGFIRTAISLNALTGDGTPQGTMDRAQQHGMSPQECAARIVRAVDRGRSEVLIGGRERLAVYLKRFSPGLFRRVIRRVRVT